MLGCLRSLQTMMTQPRAFQVATFVMYAVIFVAVFCFLQASKDIGGVGYFAGQAGADIIKCQYTTFGCRAPGATRWQRNSPLPGHFCWAVAAASSRNVAQL